MEAQIRTQKAIRGRDRAFQSLSLGGLVAKDPGLVGSIRTDKSLAPRRRANLWARQMAAFQICRAPVLRPQSTRHRNMPSRVLVAVCLLSGASSIGVIGT